jgi:hypothetical protein
VHPWIVLENVKSKERDRLAEAARARLALEVRDRQRPEHAGRLRSIVRTLGGRKVPLFGGAAPSPQSSDSRTR